jgi:NTE family protein
METPTKPPRIALVLGSGGLKCIATLGLLRVLMRRGIPVDLVAGSSGGSIFAACYGSYPDDYEKIEGFLWSYWTPNIFRDYDYGEILRTLIRPKKARATDFGIIKGERIYRNLKAMFPGMRMENARVPTRIIATDIARGSAVVLDRGETARAVRASISLPLYMKPVLDDGRLLVDGGLSNPLPLDVAAAAGAKVIICMGFESSLDTPMSHPLNLLNQVIRMRANQALRSKQGLESLHYPGTIISIRPNFGHHHSFFNFHTMREIISLGEEATNRSLPRIERAIELSQREASPDPLNSPQDSPDLSIN